MPKKIVFVLNAVSLTRCQKRVQEFIDHGYEVDVYGFERGGETYAKPANYEIETIGYHTVSMRSRTSPMQVWETNCYAISCGRKTGVSSANR